MKSLLLILFVSLLNLPALAAPSSTDVKAALEAYPNCERFVRYDNDNLYLGFGANASNMGPERKFPPLEVRVVPIIKGGAVRTFTTADSALDAVHIGDALWVLTYTGLEEWDLAAGVRRAIYPTIASSHPLAYKEHPTAMAQEGQHLFISHGLLGFSVFDVGSKRVISQTPLLQSQAPRESMATGIAMAGGHIFISMDSYTLAPEGEKDAFRGLVLVDPSTFAVEKALDGLDVGNDALATDGTKLIVSFDGNPVWKYTITSLVAAGAQMPEPERRLWKFPIAGHPTGIAAMDGVNYYTCFVEAPPHQGGVYRAHPHALDRVESGLN